MRFGLVSMHHEASVSSISNFHVDIVSSLDQNCLLTHYPVLFRLDSISVYTIYAFFPIYIFFSALYNKSEGKNWVSHRVNLIFPTVWDSGEPQQAILETWTPKYCVRGGGGKEEEEHLGRAEEVGNEGELGAGR